MTAAPPAATPRLPAGIWVLGFVSLLMDISSEMIHALLPLFMVGTLGMGVALVGLLEGLAEATALILKVCSGVISDWFGRRKPLAVLGYGLGAATKPLFALATGPGLIFTARLLDRVGKGIRGAPRDALVADIAPPEQRGAAFGLRQSLDTVGAFVGPLLAVGLMLLWANDFRAVFAVAIIPAALCVALLVLGVQEPERPAGAPRVNPISRTNLKRLPRAYWWVVGVGAVFTLARFSEAFLVLRAEQVGIALATGPGMIFTARLLDRVGKGIRGAPRDALVADIAPPEQRGAAFGLRQSLDTVGAFLGPLLAVGLMLLWANDFRAVFAVAVVPALLAVLLLMVGVREPARPAGAARSNPISRANLKRLPRAYWWVVGVGAVFTLARFSEAFLVLRAEQLGMALALVPLVMVAMNVVYSLTAYPFGKLSDRVSHHGLLLAGLSVLVLADVVLAVSTHWVGLLLGVALWGVHMGMTQGLLAAMVADTAPADLRGTAYGFFNLMSGLAMLAASVVAGLLWQYWGPAWTFGAGAMFSAVAMAALLWRRG